MIIPVCPEKRLVVNNIKTVNEVVVDLLIDMVTLQKVPIRLDLHGSSCDNYYLESSTRYLMV